MEWEKSQLLKKIIENSVKTTIDSHGRVYVPKKYRDQLKINPEEPIFAILQENGILLLTTKEYVRKIELH
jgi:bifunctional DNA-binding transcriptional regulator/antitoxin component of YhaV-PrlF toxin-antitoxin module